jgi:ribosomal protein L23
MALTDIFKKKKKPEKKIIKPKEELKEIKKETRTEKPVEIPKVRKERKSGEAHWILKAPHVTEKATSLTDKNQYIFKVSPRANKTEIKKTVRGIFGVDVVSVNIINVPEKERRLGRTKGFRKGYKKAIVRIKEGQKIEVLPR